MAQPLRLGYPHIVDGSLGLGNKTALLYRCHRHPGSPKEISFRRRKNRPIPQSACNGLPVYRSPIPQEKHGEDKVSAADNSSVKGRGPPGKSASLPPIKRGIDFPRRASIMGQTTLETPIPPL